MADQCYFNGDFYQCATATTAGQSPTTTPASWRKVRLPVQWRQVLAKLTYANLLELDGQKDKAQAERAAAYSMPRAGLDQLIRDEANAERHLTGRPSVQVNVNC